MLNLGVPLIHGRVTEHTYKLLLDWQQQRLSYWRASSLNFVGSDHDAISG